MISGLLLNVSCRLLNTILRSKSFFLPRLAENSKQGQLVGSVALLVARQTNDRKVAGSRPTKVVCIIVLTGNRMGVNCSLWPAATPSSEL